MMSCFHTQGEENECRGTGGAKQKADPHEWAAVIRAVSQYWNLSQLPR
jgi:hypothetical protein